MIKKEIVISKMEQMQQTLENVLDVTNNICIMVHKSVVEKIRCKNEKRLNQYIEYTLDYQNGEKTIIMLENMQGEYMKLRRFSKENICFTEPKNPKNMLVLDIVA